MNSAEVAKTEPFPSNGKGGFAKRHKPKPNKPEPCPEDLKFMFERLTPEQVFTRCIWPGFKSILCTESDPIYSLLVFIVLQIGQLRHLVSPVQTHQIILSLALLILSHFWLVKN